MGNTSADDDAVWLPDYFVPTDRDVICGWARQHHGHVGNQRFRKLVEFSVPLYIAAKTKLEKTQVIASVVEKVRTDSTGGGFIKKCLHTSRWYEIGDDKARDKVGHAIRRAVEDSKKNKNKKGSKAKQAAKSMPTASSSSVTSSKSAGATVASSTKNLGADPLLMSSQQLSNRSGMQDFSFMVPPSVASASGMNPRTIGAGMGTYGNMGNMNNIGNIGNIGNANAPGGMSNTLDSLPGLPQPHNAISMQQSMQSIQPNFALPPGSMTRQIGSPAFDLFSRQTSVGGPTDRSIGPGSISASSLPRTNQQQSLQQQLQQRQQEQQQTSLPASASLPGNGAMSTAMGSFPGNMLSVMASNSDSSGKLPPGLRMGGMASSAASDNPLLAMGLLNNTNGLDATSSNFLTQLSANRQARDLQNSITNPAAFTSLANSIYGQQVLNMSGIGSSNANAANPAAMTGHSSAPPLTAMPFTCQPQQQQQNQQHQQMGSAASALNASNISGSSGKLGTGGISSGPSPSFLTSALDVFGSSQMASKTSSMMPGPLTAMAGMQQTTNVQSSIGQLGSAMNAHHLLSNASQLTDLQQQQLNSVSAGSAGGVSASMLLEPTPMPTNNAGNFSPASVLTNRSSSGNTRPGGQRSDSAQSGNPKQKTTPSRDDKSGPPFLEV